MRSYNPNPTTKKTGRGRGKGTEKEKSIVVYLYLCLYLISVFFVVGLVWALPRSLAATQGISLDFSSSGY